MLMRNLNLLLCAVLLVACGRTDAQEYRIETVAEGLEHPWSIAFLPDGRMLVTERAGRLRIIEAGRLKQAPVRGVPEAHVRSQSGLFEVMLDPDYEDNGWIYLSLAHGTSRANSTRVVRARLEGDALRDVEVLFTASPQRNTSVHYGGRMAFLADGTLAIGLGDGFNFREDAQRLDSTLAPSCASTVTAACRPTIPLSAAPAPCRRSTATVIATSRGWCSMARPACFGRMSTAPAAGTR
jgi:aldose sugar dehydrogenase